MQFTFVSLLALVAAASAGPLAPRQFVNTTISSRSLSSKVSTRSSVSLVSKAQLTTTTSSRNATVNARPTTVPATVATVQTLTSPPARPTVTVYQPELYVTIINGVTVVVNIYGGVPVTTVVQGKTYTITAAPQKTVTSTIGTQTVVVVQPATTTAVPTLTTTITVGGAPSTVVYVPSAGPTSTQGAPVPVTTVLPNYYYTPIASVCACPLASTVTQYVTITAPTTTSSPAVATPVASAPSNCAYPNIAASPTLFPGLIIPVQSKNPTTAYGTQYSATVNASQEVVFQFNVQKTGSCSVELALPAHAQLTTSSWSLSGSGGLSLAKVPNSVDTSLTFAKLPTALAYTSFDAVQNGIAVVGSSFHCVAGTTATFVLKSNSGEALSFFEDYNCPYVGLALVEA